ncbi:MAG: hypothetical protein JWR63_2807 [Conexibacter sp.]|nr:hypothetical protein [Conexibacter sp.]
MSASLDAYDHAGAVAAIVAGYHRSVMATRPGDDDETDSGALKRREAERAREEGRSAREADQPAEERAHERRADKAAYLRDKLAEAEAADRATGADRPG